MIFQIGDEFSQKKTSSFLLEVFNYNYFIFVFF